MENLGIDTFFCERLKQRGIQKPLDIQSLVIPRLLKGEDVLFSSPTGTGKTFAYLLPLLQRLFLNSNNTEHSSSTPHSSFLTPHLLIVAPTLELCSQIKTELDFLIKDWLLDSTGQAKRSSNTIRSCLLIGSARMNRQIDTLKKERPHIVVGNPSRLVQLAKMRHLRLGGIKALVLDEADKLVSDEIRHETETLLGYAKNKDRQTIACSATISDKNKDKLLARLKPNAAVIQAKGIPGKIEHWAFFAENRKKISTLRSFLAAAKPKKALVFTARGADAGNILSQLQHHHFAAGGIWGDMEKRARKAAMDGFRNGSLSILVASDLACRGLDIQDLSHVIALDVPDDPELYQHRCGRTGRTGKRGIMANIGNEIDLRNLQKIEKKLGIVVYPKELYGGRILTPEVDGE